MDQEFGIIELPPPSFPLPLSTHPPPSSSSQPTPPQFSQAVQPKGNYWLPAQYEDFNPEPLWPLEEEDKQPTAALSRLHLIVHNRLQTAFAYCENTLTSLPLILTPLILKRTFTELEGLILYLFGHHPCPLFIEMNQSKCL